MPRPASSASIHASKARSDLDAETTGAAVTGTGDAHATLGAKEGEAVSPRVPALPAPAIGSSEVPPNGAVRERPITWLTNEAQSVVWMNAVWSMKSEISSSGVRGR